jgi:acetyl-CoA acetyltransferase
MRSRRTPPFIAATWSLDVPDLSGRKVLATVTDDEGIYSTTAERLAKLRPVKQGGTVSFATQTHPADGNCGMVVTSCAQTRELSRDRAIEIQVLGFGQARAKKGFMTQATVPDARNALKAAEVSLSDIKAIKTHNPFAVNDIYLAREFGVPLESFNGCAAGDTGAAIVLRVDVQ